MRRAAIIVATTGLLLTPQSPASASIGNWDTPVRLRELARLDAQVRFVARHRWPRSVLVEKWHGRPFIVVGLDADLPTVARAAPSLLVARKDRVWDLEASLFVVHGATLSIAQPSVRELRLVEHASVYATIVAYNSNVGVRGIRRERLWVHTWAPARHAPDLSLDNGRGSVSIRGAGRIDASYAVFSYLGFTFGRASGVSVNGFGPRIKGSGAVDHSRFSHNVFGAYTWEAKNMRWMRNTFTHNLVYGLDPHDASNWFLVDHNYAADNGRHGIIFSRLCAHNVIRDNISMRNGWHGIVIDDGRKGKIAPSSHNLIYDNVVRDNAKVGISIDGSNHDIIRNNQVRGGVIGIRIFGRRSGHAIGNQVVANSISGPKRIGILVAAPALGTRVVGNSLRGSRTAVAVRRARSTLIARSRTDDIHGHAVSVIGAMGTTIARNVFSGGGSSVIMSLDAVGTVAKANSAHWNYPPLHDIARLMSWFVGPGLWAIFFLLALFGRGNGRRRSSRLERSRRNSPAGT